MNMEGKIIGNFRILKQLGEGAMAAVYLACKSSSPPDMLTRFPPQEYAASYVALKQLTNENIPKNLPNRQQIVELLGNRETKNTMDANSENVVKIYSYLMDENQTI